MKRCEYEMKSIFNHDMKRYKAEEGSMLVKACVIFLIIFIALAYAGEADYQECMKGNQSIALCGGGNTK